AVIPGQAKNASVAFYIEAVDSLGATNLFPQDVFPQPPLVRAFPSDAPMRELLVRWGDTQMSGSLASYHFWISGVVSNRWRTRDNLNNAGLDGTFVYNNYRIIYNMMPQFGRSPWHRSGSMTDGPAGTETVDYVMNTPDDDKLLGTTDFVLANPGNPGGTSTTDTSAQSEQSSYIIFNEIGIHYNHRRYMHMFVNGIQ